MKGRCCYALVQLRSKRSYLADPAHSRGHVPGMVRVGLTQRSGLGEIAVMAAFMGLVVLGVASLFTWSWYEQRNSL